MPDAKEQLAALYQKIAALPKPKSTKARAQELRKMALTAPSAQARLLLDLADRIEALR